MDNGHRAARLLKALAALPFDVQQKILRYAGPHTRLVCHAFRAVHGPPPRMAPHGLDTEQQVTAAAARLPPTLHTLDLRALPGAAVTPAALGALITAAPSLRQLLLPDHDFRLTPATIAAAIVHLPHLTRLHVPGFVRSPSPTPPDLLRTVTSRLRHITFPATTIPRFSPFLTSLTAVSFQEHAPSAHSTLDAAHLAAWATPRLAALSLQSFGFGSTLVNPAHLTGLTALTSLTLAGLEAPPGTTLARTLHHIGALAGLRRLHLRFLRSGWTPDEPGWLSRLSALTHLNISFYCCSDVAARYAAAAPDGRPPCQAIWTAVTEAVESHLPQLQELSLSRNAFSSHGSGALLGPGLWHIAAAPQLRRLRLRGFDLPTDEAALLGQRLQGLTCLQLAHCSTVRAPPAAPVAGAAAAAGGGLLGALGGFGGMMIARGGLALDWGALDWVGGLRNLRVLGCEGDGLTPCMRPPPVALLGALPHLAVLSVRGLGVQADYVRCLVEAAPQLAQLDLGMNPAIGPALGDLTALTSLRVLDLSLAAGGSRDLMELPDMARLKAPRSLQRCYVLGAEEWQPSAGVRAANVHVDFRKCQRDDAEDW